MKGIPLSARRWFAWLVLVLVAPPAWADCPLELGHGTGWVVFSERYMIAFRPDPSLIEVGEPFALVLNVCTKGGDAAELVAVDVQLSDELPSAGQRSKIVRSTIVPGADGRYRAEGLLFRTTGNWEVAFDVRSGKEIERLTHEIILK